MCQQSRRASCAIDFSTRWLQYPEEEPIDYDKSTSTEDLWAICNQLHHEELVKARNGSLEGEGGWPSGQRWTRVSDGR
jgi:hypothetical protein